MSHVRTSSGWKALVSGTAVKVGGAWKNVSQIHVRTSSGWKLAWSALAVDHADETVNSAQTSPNDSYATYTISHDGDWYESTSTSAFLKGTSQGTWLTAGSSSDVWVERTINSGSLTLDEIGATRRSLAASSEYSLGISRTSIGSSSANVTLTFYDAASGGNVLDTATISITAQVII